MAAWKARQGEARERVMKGRWAVAVLGRDMNGRSVCMGAETGTGNTAILPALSYASVTWTQQAARRSRTRAVEIRYMRGVCQDGREKDGLDT